MSIVLAISGGVDSMVMLDIFGDHFSEKLVKQYDDLLEYGCARPEVIAATFNHGTRSSAKEDVKFVVRRCDRRYFQMPCFTATDDLGEGVAEEIARKRRYKFLDALVRDIQKPNALITIREDYDETKLEPPTKKDIYIFTAHHLDDLVETVAINLLRGTGWRGLAVLDTPGVVRPFLEPDFLPETLQRMAPFTKKYILKYAADFDVIFRQDPTNSEDNYLRNRVREKLSDFDDEKKMKLYELWRRQKKLKREIDELVAELLPKKGEKWQRDWFKDLDNNVALELLRAEVQRAGVSATRPQLERFRQAIINYVPGKCFNLPGDKLVRLNRDDFEL